MNATEGLSSSSRLSHVCVSTYGPHSTMILRTLSMPRSHTFIHSFWTSIILPWKFSWSNSMICTEEISQVTPGGSRHLMPRITNKLNAFLSERAQSGPTDPRGKTGLSCSNFVLLSCDILKKNQIKLKPIYLT